MQKLSCPYCGHEQDHSLEIRDLNGCSEVVRCENCKYNFMVDIEHIYKLTEKKAACQNGYPHKFTKQGEIEALQDYRCEICGLWKGKENLPSFRVEIEYLPCKKCNGDKSFYCTTCNGSGLVEQETVFT